jgi:NADPH:quinone reductase-like Zn-dependent oxidoreductase
LVYSGSTAVGNYAVQLAHLSGYKIVTTASPKNHGTLNSLGADVAFDVRISQTHFIRDRDRRSTHDPHIHMQYRDPDLLAKVRAVTGDTLRIALDCFSSPESQQFSVEAIGTEGGKVFTVSRLNPEAAALRSDVSLQCASTDMLRNPHKVLIRFS